VVIEHNLEVIKTADWIIDLGPDGGDAGGEVVVAGTPEMIAGEPRSATGTYLRHIIGGAAGNGTRSSHLPPPAAAAPRPRPRPRRARVAPR